jgi:hypothetical protein
VPACFSFSVVLKQAFDLVSWNRIILYHLFLVYMIVSLLFIISEGHANIRVLSNKMSDGTVSFSLKKENVRAVHHRMQTSLHALLFLLYQTIDA